MGSLLAPSHPRSRRVRRQDVINDGKTGSEVDPIPDHKAGRRIPYAISTDSGLCLLGVAITFVKATIHMDAVSGLTIIILPGWRSWTAL